MGIDKVLWQGGYCLLSSGTENLHIERRNEILFHRSRWQNEIANDHLFRQINSPIINVDANHLLLLTLPKKSIQIIF
jgi:hypothetical protein